MNKILKVMVGSALAATVLVSPFDQEVSAERGEWMPIEVNLEGKILDLPTDPVIKSGTTLVPMRAIFEALGAKVTWDAKTKKVEAVKDSTTIELTIGSKSGKVNGKISEASVPPQLVKGNTLIPLRYVSEAMGMHVAWVESERQVVIAQDKEIEGTTMSSVTALYNKYAPTFKGERFSEQPSYSAPYKAGKLNDGFLQDGLKSANFVREMAGLPVLVLDEQLNTSAQYGATLLVASNQLTHTPSKPSDMLEDFFSAGYAATKSSSIHRQGESHTSDDLFEAVKSLVNDAGVEGLGHRKWALSPKLYKVGFGYGSKVVPNSTSGTKGATKAGDEYVVEISGVNNTDGTPATIKYTVKLFAL